MIAPNALPGAEIEPPVVVTEKMAAAIEATMVVLNAATAWPRADRRAIAVARTQFETAFLWLANAMGGASIFDASTDNGARS